MNQGKYVFSQLIEFLPHNDFNRCVSKFNGNYKVKTFTCWHQMLCMIFGQLSHRDSLSDLVVCLQSQKNKAYHLGFGKGASKSNLAKANERRDYHIYESFATLLMEQAHRMGVLQDDSFTIDVEAPVYAIDATVVDLCLNLFWWGKFRKRKAAVKLHTMLDVKTNIPTVAFITSGGIHEVNLLGNFPIEEGSYYLMDKGFTDFEEFYNIDNSLAYFVIPAKKNLSFARISSKEVDKTTGVICDQVIRLKNQKVTGKYPKHLRRIRFYDRENDLQITLLTNNFEVSSEDIAGLYRYRWRIEIFFKWIKQHLKVKTFWGYSFNAVRTQIYIAIITYLLVSIMKHQMKLKQTQYEILQILSISLLCKMSLTELFSNPDPQIFEEVNSNQLSIFQ